jgi:UPF0755 protein
MKGFARVIVVFLTLVALAVGFVGGTVVLDVFQPSNKNVTTVVEFEVKSGDTSVSIAQRLQDDGLIRNAAIFHAWVHYRKLLNSGVESGIYYLSPNMTMGAIITKLEGKPDKSNIAQVFVVLNDHMRATEYPAKFTKLPQFSAKEFLAIAKTGIEPDGTKLWQKYWYIKQPIPGKTAYALEGYLYPAGYYFYTNATAQDVIEKLITQFGEELCPGPSSAPAQYITDAKQCRAHAFTVGGKNIFDAMLAAYPDAKTDVAALSDTLIIASLATQEIKKATDFAGVAAVYHNRYLNIETQGTADVGYSLGSDPSAEYARDTITPPTNGKWWAAPADASKIAVTNPYNTRTQSGMPPGAISNPFITDIKGAAAPGKSPYYYFVSDKCGKFYYATNLADFNNNVKPKQDTGNC